MDAVPETNVPVAGLCSREGVSNSILTRIPDGRFREPPSVPLLLEHEAALKRREHSSASGLDAEDIDTILDLIAANARSVRLHSPDRAKCR